MPPLPSDSISGGSAWPHFRAGEGPQGCAESPFHHGEQGPDARNFLNLFIDVVSLTHGGARRNEKNAEVQQQRKAVEQIERWLERTFDKLDTENSDEVRR